PPKKWNRRRYSILLPLAYTLRNQILAATETTSYYR
ncbi:hypothetical protein PENVUL_c333G04668, partial [Penicillium vulpinum]